MASLARSLAPVAAVTGASAVLILSFDTGVAALGTDQPSNAVGAATAQGGSSSGGRHGDGTRPGPDGQAPGGSTDGSAGSGAAGSGSASGSGATGSSSGSCDAQEVSGPVVSTQFGPVQVAAKVSSGKVCAVRTLQYPNMDHESVQINSQAIPMLDQMAVESGDANFAGVSGATYTTDGYRQSLQAILDQAK